MLAPENVGLLPELDIIDRVFEHIDNGTTDLGTRQWQEPVGNYHSQERFEREIALLKSRPVVFCPSSALPEIGSYITRTAAGTPLLAVRGQDRRVRTFINACRHRGMKVADGEGCARTFSCPYHAWTYGLDGALRGVPGKTAFPDLDSKTSGLVEVSAVEKGGLVYVMQEGVITPDMLDCALDFFSSEQTTIHRSETLDEANWKLLTETLLEGYHIKSLHRDSFYPFGLDNTNVVETYGENSRIVYPFKRIEKLREIDRADRRIEGSATLVYHLFPNVSVSILSKHTSITIIEPISPSNTRMYSFNIQHADNEQRTITLEDAMRDIEFVSQSGQEEDREAARAIQETVTTNANTHLTFGYFENAIVSFHENLHAALNGVEK